MELLNRKEILHPAAEAYILELENNNRTLTCTMLNDMVHHSELTELEKKYETEILERAGIYLTRRLEADEIIGKLKIEIENQKLKDQVQALVTIMEKYP